MGNAWITLCGSRPHQPTVMRTSPGVRPSAEATSFTSPAVVPARTIASARPRHALRCGCWKLSVLFGLLFATAASVASPYELHNELQNSSNHNNKGIDNYAGGGV